MPSAFFSRSRGDKLAENYTHSDGAIGHFKVGGNGKGDLVVSPTAKQLIILVAPQSQIEKGIFNQFMLENQ